MKPIHLKASLLNETHLNEILGSERAHIVDECMCAKSTEQDILKCLESGCSFGLIFEGKIIAYTLAYLTEYGTAYIEKCFVWSCFRGRKLQQVMLGLNLAAIEQKGAQEIFAMTAPSNKPSLCSFIRAGFAMKRSVRYNGHERVILKFGE